MFVRIEESEAEKLALVLDSVEADLVSLQHRVFRVREALQEKAGKPCGYQYTGRRVTGRPEFYMYGCVIDGITHWAPLPEGPKP